MMGMILRYERTKQGFSQELLAHGICSVSYLSKLENGVIVPSDEIASLLFSKLNISYSASTSSEIDLEFKECLNDFFINDSLEVLENLLNKYDGETKPVYSFYYACARIFVDIIRGKFDVADVKDLEINTDAFNSEYKYYYYMIAGILCFSRYKEFSLATHFFSLAMDNSSALVTKISRATALLENGNLLLALFNFQESYCLALTSGTSREIKLTLKYIIYIYALLGNNELCIRYVDEYSRLTNEIVKDDYWIQYRMGILKCFCGDYRGSLTYFDRCSDLLDPKSFQNFYVSQWKFYLCIFLNDDHEAQKQIINADAILLNDWVDELQYYLLAQRMHTISNSILLNKENTDLSMVIKLIEDILREEKWLSLDFRFLFCSILLLIYKKSRQYKQAVALLERYPYLQILKPK